MRFVVARDQYFLNPVGHQDVRGYDKRTVIAEGNTVDAAIRRAGGWWGHSGYRLYLSKSAQEVKVDHTGRRWIELPSEDAK